MSDLISILYIVAFVIFFVGRRMVGGPRTAVAGNLVAAVGLAGAVVGTLLDDRLGNWALIAVGSRVGPAIGDPCARSV
jgi:NAD(P) transhydrogenase subunit beta